MSKSHVILDHQELLNLQAARKACQERIYAILRSDRGGWVEIQLEKENARQLTLKIESLERKLARKARRLSPAQGALG